MRKRIVCLTAALVLSGTLASCKPEPKPIGSSSSSDSVSDWSLPVGSEAENTSSTEEFDNVSGGTESRPTPGANNTSSRGTATEQPVSSDKKPEEKLPDSQLKDRDSLRFYYESDSYAYGITANNAEIIAFREPSGTLLDVLSGGGTYVINSISGLPLLYDCVLSGFEQVVMNNSIALIATYRAVGQHTENAILENTYIFYDEHISVSAKITYTNDSYKISGERSQLQRLFINGAQSVRKDFTTNWVYPRDGDFPYPTFDSWATVNTIDSNHKLYTFLRGDGIDTTYSDHYKLYPEMNLPVFFDDANGVSYTSAYDLVLETVQKGRDSDYLALFAGRNSDFAAGIAPLKANDDFSTVFVADEVTLNLNVTNLTGNKAQFSARYDVRDYYGNVVDAGIYINSTVFGGLDANRHVKISAKNTGKYGIYYLNYMVVSPYHTHRETYPFILLPDHDYTYNTTSPFGINGVVKIEGRTDALDFVNTAAKIGVAKVRVGDFIEDIPGVIEFLKEYKKRDIQCTLISAHAATLEYTRKTIEPFKDYVDRVIVGNENNFPSISGEKTVEQTFNDYKNKQFKFGYDLVKETLGKTYVIAGISAGQSAWYDILYSSGYWNKFDVINYHVYGIPWRPDSREGETLFWNIEDGMKRTKKAMEQYGYKPTEIHEMGYPVIAESKTEVDLRTQADYNVRGYILGLAYGAQVIGAYSFVDISSSGRGIDQQDMEYHFGAFYYPDYFGRLMPKPFVGAFSALTRQLESVTGVTFNQKYTQGQTRAFDVQTKESGKVIVAWSNVEPLANDSVTTSSNRKPTPPWKNQWEKAETIAFESDKNKVVVRDIMGNSDEYSVTNGKVSIPVNGSPIYIYGVK